MTDPHSRGATRTTRQLSPAVGSVRLRGPEPAADGQLRGGAPDAGARRGHGRTRAFATTPSSVRLATLDDLDVVVQLRLALLREEAKVATLPPLRRDASLRARNIFAAELEGGHGATYLAFDRSRAVGVLRCTISRNTQLVRPRRYAYLSWGWVRPGFRRRGVLRAMVTAAEEWCRERRVTEIRLRVNLGNAVGNASWEALGFAPEELVLRRAIARD